MGWARLLTHIFPSSDKHSKDQNSNKNQKVVKQMNEGVNLATGTLHFAFKDQTTVNNFFGLFQQYHSFRLFNGAKK